MRKSALEIWLELWRTAAHVPGAVLPLRVHQKLHTFLVNRVGRCQESRLLQRGQRLSGGVGIARQIAILPPSAIGVLCGR